MYARAAVIGVATTTYGDGVFPPLPGVRGDVVAVRDMLCERGFDVALAGDASAPGRQEVQERLVGLVDATGAADLAVLYLAGHGFLAADTSGDEADRWDECFVCADGAIRDDWFRDELWPRARSGTRFVVVVDACHSGSMTLSLAPDEDAPPQVARLGSTSGGYSRLVLAACRDEGVTAELSANEHQRGIMTLELLEVLRDRPRISYRALAPEVAARVRRYRFTGIDEPQLRYQAPDDILLDSTAFVGVGR